MDNLPCKSKIKLPRKGHKGDPRMHRAVEAKLRDPKISLYKALIIGGFEYPEPNENDKSSTYSLQDSEGALLGQRKNQLSRRLREAKNQIKKKAENGQSVVSSAVDNEKDAACQSSMNGNNSSAKKMYDKEMNDVISPLAAASDCTIHENELTVSEKLKTIHYHKEPKFKVQISGHKSDKNSKAVLFPKGYASIFSEKLKDCDSFGFPAIPIPTDTSSLLNYCTKPNQDSIDKHEYEIECSAKNPALTEPFITNNELNTKILSNSKSSNATNRNRLVSDSSNILRSNDFKSSDDFTESGSVFTTLSFKSKNEQKNAMLQKAMDIFGSNIDSYLRGIMVKAGYSRNEITEEDYLAFFASTISLSIERFQSISAGSTASCYLVSSAPTKKRKLDNNSNVSYPKFIFNGKQAHEQQLRQDHSHHTNVPHIVEPKDDALHSFCSNKQAVTTIISDLTYESNIEKHPE